MKVLVLVLVLDEMYLTPALAGIVADATLPSVQRRFTPRRVPHGLHAETPGSSAITETYGRGASVATGNRMGVDT